MTARRFIEPEPVRDLDAELRAFDRGQHAALEQDRAVARASARRAARAEANTPEGRDLIDAVLVALQRAHRDGAYRLVLIQDERVVRCRYTRNPKLFVVANVVRTAAEDALRAAGLEVLRSPGSSWDLDACKPRADRDSTPPSTTRPLLAADREYQRLRTVALDAFGELTGMVGAGVQRLGGHELSDETRRDLTGLAKDLSRVAFFPSTGDLVGVAVACAQKARDVAVEQPAMEQAAWAAAEACLALAKYADEWTIRQAGGGL